MDRDIKLHIQAVPIRVDTRNTDESGLDLRRTTAYASTGAPPIKLKRKDTFESAFACVILGCLAHIQANELGVVNTEEAEPVHQMRVGIRRLRSALKLVEPLVVFPVSLMAELQWIVEVLGAARDWEVLATSTLPGVFGDGTANLDGEVLIRLANETALRHRVGAAAAVDSPRYSSLAVDIELWFEQAHWRDDHDADRRDALNVSAREFGAKALRERHRKLMKRGRQLPDLDPVNRHRARIAAKNLRYALEFFGSLYDKRSLRKYVETLTRLQDDLGSRNDITVAERILQQLALTAPVTVVSASYARGFLASRAAGNYDKLNTLWRGIKRLSMPE